MRHRSRAQTTGRRAVAALTVATAVLIPTVVRAQHESRDPESYTASPAYVQHCSACHGRHLDSGLGGSLVSDAFKAKWQGQGPTLLEYVMTRMPVGKEGSLARADYVAATNDIIALADLGDPVPLDPAAAAAMPENVIRMDVDWLSKLKSNNDAVAQAEAARRSRLLEALSPATPQSLERAPDGDWLHWRRTYDGTGFSPLAQIDRGNVAGLQLAWAQSLPLGTNAITPLVRDGVMFVNSNGVVRAIDAVRGDVLWQFSRDAERRMQASQPRSMALAGSLLLVSTADVHMLALDVRTGAVVWDHAIEPEGTAYHIDSGPIVIRDKVIQGITGCYDAALPGGCFFVALDLATGKEVWRFHSIARPGEPGGDSWNGAPLGQRFGGSIWSTGTYDPVLDLLFIGTSQTYHLATLLEPQARKGASGDALYTNSTLAIDPDTGKLVWYYQHFPGDLWDQDWAFERTILDLPTPQGTRRAVVTVGKIGIVDALDAKTGQYLFSIDVGLQDIVERIDPKSGRKFARSSAIPRKDGVVTVCPSSLGVRSWPATAVDPTRGILVMAANEACMDVMYEPGKGTDTGWVHKPRPDSDGNIGGLYGIDLATRKVLWKDRRRATGSSAVLATAGGLAFEGSRDRWFRAFDTATGKVLWEVRLDGPPSSFPISYSVGGQQYIAVTAGGGNVNDTFWRTFTPEIRSHDDSTTLWVFALPAAGATNSRAAE